MLALAGNRPWSPESAAPAGRGLTLLRRPQVQGAFIPLKGDTFEPLSSLPAVAISSCDVHAH
jgi:hypothetical protein